MKYSTINARIIVINLPIAASSPRPSSVLNVKTKFSVSNPDSGLRRTLRLPVPTNSEKLYLVFSNPKTNAIEMIIMITRQERRDHIEEEREDCMRRRVGQII